MEFVTFIVNTIIVVTSLIILYFAYVKNSNLGRLSIFVIFGSLLLQEFLGILQTLDFLSVLSSLFGTISTFIVYAEIILLVVLFLGKIKEKSNQVFKASLLILVVLKILIVFI
jgi:hypothetical protein